MRRGSSLSRRPSSLIGEPMMKVPAGTITISGHSAQSLNVSFGLRQRVSLPTCASTPSQPACADGAAGSIERSETSAHHHIVAAAPSGAPNIKTVWLCCILADRTDAAPAGRLHRPVHKHGKPGAAHCRPRTTSKCRPTNQGGATIAVALHASKMVVGKRAGDATEIAIVLGRKSGPVARKRTASAAAPTERGCSR
jgi:hypothetical protein